MNLLTTPTACVMSGLVHIIAFIRLSTTDALGTRDFSILSASLLGLIREEQLIESGVEIGLQSCMLKRRKIISKYFFWESQIFLSFLSRCICIPEILVCWFQVLLLIVPSQLRLQFLDLNFVGAYLQHVIHIQHQWSKHPVCCNRGLWRNQISGTNTWALFKPYWDLFNHANQVFLFFNAFWLEHHFISA